MSAQVATKTDGRVLENRGTEGRSTAGHSIDRLYIVRIDRENLKGWQVRVPKNPTSLFSDFRYGGKHGAYGAAIQHRDALLNTNRVRYLHKSPQRTHTRGSEEVGVCKFYYRNKHVGWQAYANLSPRFQSCIRFPLIKFGKDAYRRAMECRKHFEAIMELQQMPRGEEIPREEHLTPTPQANQANTPQANARKPKKAG